MKPQWGGTKQIGKDCSEGNRKLQEEGKEKESSGNQRDACNDGSSKEKEVRKEIRQEGDRWRLVLLITERSSCCLHF